jgi:hypothetical protein
MSQDLVGHGDIEITKAQNRNYALADGFQRMTSNKRSNTWPLFLRYKVLTEREYRRAIEDFERLKALRNELPNERAPQRRKSPVGESPTPRRCRYTWIASEPARRVTAGMGAS